MRKEVAIKVLKHSENSVHTIQHELNTMTLLAHENVSQVYTTIQGHGVTYLVMEIIAGGELFDTVKTWKKAERERNAFHYFNQLMTGLKFLHAAGFAHRDLKLENLLLSSDKVLKIADFGVTKDLKHNPMRTCCGSPDYIAPEIITEKGGYDGRLADLWSCGVILYAMLAGEFPFENAAAILRGSYKTPKSFPPLAKESLLVKIFVVDPKKRIQSVEDICASEWMHAFSASRNSFSAYIDTLGSLCALCSSTHALFDTLSLIHSPQGFLTRMWLGISEQRGLVTCIRTRSSGERESVNEGQGAQDQDSPCPPRAL